MQSIDQTFEDYKNQCIKDLMSLQPEFMKLYDINSYEDWSYDHGIGVFHFKSKTGKNLYFKYTDVGSFSSKTSTWNWSWNNENTPKLVSRALDKVKSFGTVNNFAPLTKGLIDGDEYTGWEMTAISSKLLNAIGAYRIPHEHLFIYFIFTNELTLEEYEELKDKHVDCDEHGSDRMAFVCQHLLGSKSAGFHEAFDSEATIHQEDDYQAWCDECENIRSEEGEWNDTSMVFSNIKIVCNQCYFNIKARNYQS